MRLRYRRTNREINPAIMPETWEDEGDKYKKFTLHPTIRQRAGFMAKFALYKERAYQKEIVCFLLSNYIANEQGAGCDGIALNVLSYGKLYRNKTSEQCHNYLVGSIPEALYKVVKTRLSTLPIKRANGLLYFVVSAFYNAPDRAVERMIKRIEELKKPCVKTKTYVSLQTMVPEEEYRLIQKYALTNGMQVNTLIRIVLRGVCMSKRDRAEDCSAIAKLFSLYRLLRQMSEPFGGERMVPLFVWVSDEREKKYLTKFLRRRGITRSEILRKAVRAFLYVIEHKQAFAGKVQYAADEADEPEDMEYVYERLAQVDFYRGIYR